MHILIILSSCWISYQNKHFAVNQIKMHFDNIHFKYCEVIRKLATFNRIDEWRGKGLSLSCTSIFYMLILIHTHSTHWKHHIEYLKISICREITFILNSFSCWLSEVKQKLKLWWYKKFLSSIICKAPVFDLKNLKFLHQIAIQPKKNITL